MLNTYNDTVKVIQVARVRILERHMLAHVQVVKRVGDHALHLDNLAAKEKSAARYGRQFLVK